MCLFVTDAAGRLGPTWIAGQVRVAVVVSPLPTVLLDPLQEVDHEVDGGDVLERRFERRIAGRRAGRQVGDEGPLGVVEGDDSDLAVTTGLAAGLAESEPVLLRGHSRSPRRLLEKEHEYAETESQCTQVQTGVRGLSGPPEIRFNLKLFLRLSLGACGRLVPPSVFKTDEGS